MIGNTLVSGLAFVVRAFKESLLYSKAKAKAPKNTHFVDKAKKMQRLFILVISMSSLVMSLPAAEMSDAQLDQILADKNIMQRHLRCALSQGPCDPVGRRLRILAPLVLHGACPQCSPQETMQIRKTLSHVQRNYPWDWAKLMRQYG